MAEDKNTGTRVITPKAILSYPHLFEPRAMDEGGEAKYSACLVFPEGTDLKAIEAAIDKAGRDKFGEKWHIMVKTKKATLPLRDDGEDKGYPEGSIFFNATSKTKPGIVQPYAGADGRPAPLEKEEDIYPGCYVRASINFYGYDTKGNKGVAAGLNNLQKMADGERLDFRRSARDEFDAVENAAFDAADPLL